MMYEVSDMLGKVFVSVVQKDDAVIFTDEAGVEYGLWHDDDCCESVHLEDVCGNLEDLVGSPLVMAEESRDSDTPKVYEGENSYQDESFTWTFYKFATVKGYVTLRWYGSSNGYYSES